MKTLKTSFKFMILMTILTGFIYPAIITATAQILFHRKAQGSFIPNGSELISQNFTKGKYFFSRPSAIDFNPNSSGGSNLSPTSADLLAKFNERKKQGLTHEMLFTSGSGLDPHISPEAAKDQLPRIAKARNLTVDQISLLLNEYIEPRQFGILGQTRVNVLKLNLALDERFK